jgi:hypothetical protein
VVTAEHAQWAINLVRRSVRTVLRPFETGEAGASDAMLADALVCKAVVEFFEMTPEERAQPKHGVPETMQAQRALIPWNYFYKRLIASQVKPFKSKPGLLKDTVQNLVKGDVLVLLDKNQAWQQCRTRGDVYGVGSNFRGGAHG